MSTDELICDTGNIVCVCIGVVLGGALRCLTSFAALMLMFLVRMLRSLSFQKLKTSLAPDVGSYTPSRHVKSRWVIIVWMHSASCIGFRTMSYWELLH